MKKKNKIFIYIKLSMSVITFLVIFKGRKYEVSYDSSMKIKDFILDITYKYIGKSQLIEMNVL